MHFGIVEHISYRKSKPLTNQKGVNRCIVYFCFHRQETNYSESISFDENVEASCSMPNADNDAVCDLSSITEEILPSLTMQRTVNLVPVEDRLSTEDKERRQALVYFFPLLLIPIFSIQAELRARKTSEERQELQAFFNTHQNNGTTDEANGARTSTAQEAVSDVQPPDIELQTQSFSRVRRLF